MAQQDALTVAEAARKLGTTNERIVQLIKRGIPSSRRSDLDRRRRLIPREQVERILREGVSSPERPRPKTVGMYAGPVRVTSDEVNEYLAKRSFAPTFNDVLPPLG